MRNVLRIAGMVAFLSVVPGMFAADVSGTWKGTFEFNHSPVPLTFHLSASGNTVTGTVEGLMTSPAEIHDGKIDGDTLSFWLDTDYQGQTYKLVYKGKVTSGEIDFSFGTEDGSWASTLIAKSESLPANADVSGNWRGAFNYNGNDVALTFHLTTSGGTVTGTVEGLPTSPAEIHDGKINGDTVSFWVNTDYQGTTYKLIYTGKVSPEGIKFTLGTDDGSWATQLVATKAS